MRNGKKVVMAVSLVLVLAALTAVISGTVSSLLQSSKTIPNAGLIKGIGVGIYWDLACTNKTSSIDWGLLDPGSSKSVTVYVRNEGNAPATLSKTVQNWNPSTATSYLTLNWNYAGQTLSVNQVFQMKLTLVVSSTISGITSFSFDTSIIATA